MSKLRIQGLVAIVLASVLVSVAAPPAAGYVAQREVKIYLSGPSRVKCDQKATIRARIVRLKNGKPVANQAIKWTFALKRHKRDRLSRFASTTNRRGVTTVNVKFGPKAGKRIIQARIPGLKPKIAVTCRGGLN